MGMLTSFPLSTGALMPLSWMDKRSWAYDDVLCPVHRQPMAWTGPAR